MVDLRPQTRSHVLHSKVYPTSLTPHSHQGPMRVIIGMVSDHYESPVATRKKRNVPWEKTVGPVGLKLDA